MNIMDRRKSCAGGGGGMSKVGALVLVSVFLLVAFWSHADGELQRQLEAIDKEERKLQEMKNSLGIDRLSSSLDKKITAPINAETLAAVKDDIPSISLGKGISNLKIRANLRLGYERFQTENGNIRSSNDSYHQRVRIGLTFTGSDKFSFDIGLATGGNNATSANDYFGTRSDFETGDLRLDYAYATYVMEQLYMMERVQIIVGQQPNPFLDSGLLFDADVRPVGITGKFNSGMLFFTLGLYSVVRNIDAYGDDSKSDNLLVSAQIGFEGKMQKIDYRVALGLHRYNHGVVDNIRNKQERIREIIPVLIDLTDPNLVLTLTAAIGRKEREREGILRDGQLEFDSNYDRLDFMELKNAYTRVRRANVALTTLENYVYETTPLEFLDPLENLKNYLNDFNIDELNQYITRLGMETSDAKTQFERVRTLIDEAKTAANVDSVDEETLRETLKEIEEELKSSLRGASAPVLRAIKRINDALIKNVQPSDLKRRLEGTLRTIDSYIGELEDYPIPAVYTQALAYQSLLQDTLDAINEGMMTLDEALALLRKRLDEERAKGKNIPVSKTKNDLGVGKAVSHISSGNYAYQDAYLYTSEEHNIHLLDLYLDASHSFGKTELMAYAHLVKNIGAADSIGAGVFGGRIDLGYDSLFGGTGRNADTRYGLNPKDNDMAYRIGVDASHDKWTVGITYSMIEADSVYGVLTDQDFGTWAGLLSTDVKGLAFKLGYQVNQHFSIAGSFFDLERIHPDVPTALSTPSADQDKGKLIYLDLNYKF